MLSRKQKETRVIGVYASPYGWETPSLEVIKQN